MTTSTEPLRRLCRPAVFLAAVLLSLVGFMAVGVAPAAATIGTNDYPAYLKNATQDSITDPWGFLNRECVSFVAWRLNNDNGVVFSNNMSGGHWGNAYQWWGNAGTLGYPRNGTPAVGAVAYWSANFHGAGSSGHVSYVRAVNADGSIDTEDYNSALNGLYATHHYSAGSANWPYGFIHAKDLTPPPAWSGVGSSATYFGSDTLAAGQQLTSGQYLLSTDARSALLLQSDGNLVLYSGSAIWYSSTGGTGANRLVMQTDGNLVLYNGSTPVWYTSTGGTGPAHAIVQSDGNFVVYNNTSGGATWQAGTSGLAPTTYVGSSSLAAGQTLVPQQYLRSADNRYGLLLQTDGNLVLYGPGYHVLWHTNTGGTGANRLEMQTDGNLVLYNGSTPVWYTSTGGTGPAHAIVQSDGNFVVYNNTSGVATWQAGTSGGI